MPHYDGTIKTSSPAILASAKGDPQRVREAIMAQAPAGANVRSVSFVSGKDEARITVEGPNAQDYLKKLEATNVVELMTGGERTKQRGPSQED
jgi:glycine cleavage system aminomethyltransferase T